MIKNNNNSINRPKRFDGKCSTCVLLISLNIRVHDYSVCLSIGHGKCECRIARDYNTPHAVF